MNRSPSIVFQAHRGGQKEVPENTIGAFEYAWSYGAIPEADVFSTRDNVIMCLHDATLARTTNAPRALATEPVVQMMAAEIEQWDAGSWFDSKYAGEKVPRLEAVLKKMQHKPERQLYLDLKDLDLDQLGSLIQAYEVNSQILFCHNIYENLVRFKQISPGVRTMLWIGGTADEITTKFAQAAAVHFDHLDQVQLHLHRMSPGNKITYQLSPEFLRQALAITQKAGIDLEVLPFEISAESIDGLLDLGITWLCTDYPDRMSRYIDKWQKNNTSQVFP